jgi:hypothetical protein
MAKKRSLKTIGRNKVILMITILSLLTITFAFWMANTAITGEIVTTIGLGAVIIVIIALMIPYIRRMASSVKRGEPLEDERSRKVKTKAAATSYYISLYWFLAISFASDYFPSLTVSGAIGLGIVGMAISWGLMYIYYNKRL